MLKHRANRGEHRMVFFYRDQNGAEADLVVETGRDLILVEAKAGQTATEDMFGVVRRVAASIGEIRPCRTVVAHGGADRQTRQGTLLLPWKELDRERSVG